ncbi:hypothetical protein BDQ17DRAFT_1542882 [Cyathus striatus]|nr:hypothetical protein BDQ17DRAFT_1542882 [Cyathus striatus]
MNKGTIGAFSDSDSDSFSFETLSITRENEPHCGADGLDRASVDGIYAENPFIIHCDDPPEPEPLDDSTKWHTLTSLLPLFQVLTGLKEQSGSYVLSGPITLTDISTFYALSKLVKVLALSGPKPRTSSEASTPSIPISTALSQEAELSALQCELNMLKRNSRPETFLLAPASLTRILPYLPQCLLLPCLERLSIDEYAWVNLPYSELRYAYPLFLISTLREIELDGCSDMSKEVLIPLLQILPSQVADLRKLIVRGMGEYRIPKDVSMSVVGMTGLWHLELDDIVDVEDFKLLEKIGQIPELTTLILKDTSLHYSLSTAGSDQHKGFKSLQNLHITGSYDLILDLLRSIKSDSLKELKISPVVDGKYDEKEAVNKEQMRSREEARGRAEEEYAKAELTYLKAQEVRDRFRADDTWVKYREWPCDPQRGEGKGCATLEAQGTQSIEVGAGGNIYADRRGRSPFRSASRSLLSRSRSSSRSQSPIFTSHPHISQSPNVGPRGVRSARSVSVSSSLGSFVLLPSQSLQALPSMPWIKLLEDILSFIPKRWPALQVLAIDLVDKSDKGRVFELPSRYLDYLRLLMSLESLRVENWKVVMDWQDALRTSVPLFKRMETRTRIPRSVSPSPLGAAISNDDSSSLYVGLHSRADSSPVTGFVPRQVKLSEYDPIPISASSQRPYTPSICTGVPVGQTYSSTTYGTDARNTEVELWRDYCADYMITPNAVRRKVSADVVPQTMIERRRKLTLFKCCKCGADFTTKQNFNYHMNSHYNIKEYKCECGREFGTRYVMRRHRNSCSIAKNNSTSGT